MEQLTLGQTIKEITRKHLEHGGLLMGQCITAVGWVNGTVPDCQNIVELPMTDVAGAGFAVGAALMGKRPIFVLRFQDFFTLNCNQFVHYAAIAKELHGVSVPVFIRCISMDNAGPVHSIVLHNIPMYFPGFVVMAPVTPGEYERVWQYYMEHDDPVFVSEHRRCYPLKEEMPDTVDPDAEIVLYGISDARINLLEAQDMLRQEGIKTSVMHIMQLKPFDCDYYASALTGDKEGLVVDNGFPICGAARDFAYELSEKTGRVVHAMSCKDSVKCFNEEMRNGTPPAQEIYHKVKEILGRK